MKKLFFPIKERRLVLLLGLVAICQLGTAQDFKVGDKDVNFGLGFGKTYYGYGVSGLSSLPAISVSADIGFTDEYGPGIIGIGAMLAYSSLKWDYNYVGGNYQWKSNDIIIGGRGTYHMDLVDGLDTYGGAMIYLLFQTYSESGTYVGVSPYNTDLDVDMGVSLFAGAKYYFTDNLAVFGELGYSITWLTLGLSLKL